MAIEKPYNMLKDVKALDASRGVYSDEDYKRKFPPITVVDHVGNEVSYPAGTCTHGDTNNPNALLVNHQPKQSWLPIKKLAMYQGNWVVHYEYGDES